MEKEKIIIGSDHAGYALKEDIKKMIKKLGYELEDVGTNSAESCDYPDFSAKVAKKVANGDGIGIVICGTGIGSCIAANKIKGIRAAMAFDEYTARMSREHNDSNVLCLGGRTTSKGLAAKIVKIWLKTGFSNEAKHKRRVNKIKALEQ